MKMTLNSDPRGRRNRRDQQQHHVVTKGDTKIKLASIFGPYVASCKGVGLMDLMSLPGDFGYI